jgi:hypothetical protein
MTDITHRTGSAGLPPSNLSAANTYNPTAGASPAHPDRVSFPPGTPVVQALAADKTVIPGRANDASTSSLTGLAAGPGIVGEPVFVQFAGVLHLETAQWDAVTGETGGLTTGAPYFLSVGFQEGRLTQTQTATPGTFVVPAGVALSPNDFMILLCSPTEVPQ